MYEKIRLSKEDENYILRWFGTISNEALAEKFGVSPSWIIKFVKEAGVYCEPPPSLSEIAKELGLKRHEVQTALESGLRKMKVELKKMGGR